MPEINILDESTINKIAAGEVVERPVSVVKELVENAIDSGAANISVEIKGGGIDYIRVTDNGCGISRDDIPKAFLRHATSKIKDSTDLLDIRSLGFRGEALSSVAAVSQTEMMTKTGEAVFGYRYRIEGGRQMSFEEAGIPNGTTIIVKNLFYNTPARRKFLKSQTTEGGYITELMERMILSHPDISFKYTLNGSLKLSSTGGGDVMADVYSVFGRDIQRLLVNIESESEICSLRGYIGKPELSRGNKNFELFFVNNRYIKSKVLSAAVEEAYKPYMMVHRFPFVILYLDICSDALDVNVHPAKTEIRISPEQDIYRMVYDAVTAGLKKRELIPEAQYKLPEPEAERKPVSSQSIAEPVIIPEPFEEKKIEELKSVREKPGLKEEAVIEPVQETLFKEGFLAKESAPSHRIIGQVFDTYWIVEFEGSMYIIDQHAAHEKVLYERFSKQIAAGEVISQMVSPPCILSFSPAQADIIEENKEILSNIGFNVEHFGGREYALTSVPAELFGLSERDYFTTVVDGLMSQTVKKPDEVADRIATMACKAAVKGNMRMSPAEAQALISELLELDNPYNCPHGRPTIISYSKQELERMFKRIV
ncbi:MAG: DNA mismatch repair endonuclease MutL [Lachnospiraceae bacterium]|nr:DNA mismatch repair endonuclease MutL [Lachnospiraceae bacterium]